MSSKVFLPICLAALLMGSNAWAQAQSDLVPIPQKLARLRVGQTVWVTTIDGTELKGALVGVTRSGLEITAAAQPRVVPIARLSKVQVKDSAMGGLVAGAVIGGVLGYYAGGPGCLDDDKCNPAGPMLWFAGALGGIGAALDAAFGHRRAVYVSARPVGVHVMPIATRKAVGLSVALNWLGRSR